MSPLGGLFLAHRALAPARLAWANQQRFIADASHELRTPLTLLRADAEVLLRSREGMTAEDAALLEDIVAEANQMADLANNLLTLVRLDSRSSHQEHEVVHLAELAQRGVRRMQALAVQTKISIEVDTDERSVVIGDPALLEQAVLALLDYAINYNRPGGRVKVRTAVQDKQALLEVEDTGIGIATKHLAHLGEPFYRVDKARSREAGAPDLDSPLCAASSMRMAVPCGFRASWIRGRLSPSPCLWRIGLGLLAETMCRETFQPWQKARCEASSLCNPWEKRSPYAEKGQGSGSRSCPGWLPIPNGAVARGSDPWTIAPTKFAGRESNQDYVVAN